MGVHLKPCHGCPIPKLLDDPQCLARRDEMRAKVSGLGLTSASFRCDVLAGHFRAGKRISINTPILQHGGYFDDGWVISHIEVRATILAFDGRSFHCVTDLEDMQKALAEDASERDIDAKDLIYRKPMRASRVVRFIDEPDRPLCVGGNVSMNDGKCDRASCHHCNPIEDIASGDWS